MQIEIETLRLRSGGHKSPEDGMCVMEAVAFVAGEPHSDHPECACPIISAFLRRWNDDLDDEGRQKLKPYIRKLVGTRSTKAIEQKRGLLVADWLLRVHTPAWLDLAGLKEQGDKIRALPELGSWDALGDFRPALAEAKTKAAAARAAAWAAAWAAAGDAAWDAAGDAAGAAAGDAARAAAGAAAWAAARDAARAAAWAAAWAAAGDAAWAAARDAARAAARAAAGDAAGDAAWDAARAAAGDAAGKKLEPTKISLQASAFELLDKLIELR
jgi:hypothetical protein